MARRKPAAARSVSAPARTPPPVTAPVRDPRPLIYYLLDQLFVVAYAYTIAKVVPNRLPGATFHLWTIPICMQVLGLGTALGIATRWATPAVRTAGWWIAIAGGSALLLSTFVLIVRVLISAAFLAGVYGAFGKAAATFALLAIAIVIEVVALLPIVQIKYLMSRAGRRAFGRL